MENTAFMYYSDFLRADYSGFFFDINNANLKRLAFNKVMKCSEFKVPNSD